MTPRARRLSPEAFAVFTHVPEIDRSRARVFVVPVLTPGVVAMTLGPWIFVRHGREQDAGLVAHELVHVQQWRELGVLRFLTRYLGEYLRYRRQGQPHWSAYAAISLEVEARVRSGA